MEPVAIVIVLALIEYFAFGALVGKARGKYGIDAPAITGDPVFERYYRVHQNTLEQLMIFIPAITIYGFYGNATYAAGLGVVFLIGRIIYLRGYVADPKTRGTGMIIGFLPTVFMLFAGLFMAVKNLL
ncbi:MAG: hypothetical protein COA96_04380 [SAR86 cluster bacterium]|uniref:MAPEG family protein n=1 Tax=SAR86 cluster bacterium TaxID=2030880 RepID=A0A2A5B6C7_9GAMM|nr:MAG: hypothetical protein COA96_04380 [SAR86 cluster bacterium]